MINNNKEFSLNIIITLYLHLSYDCYLLLLGLFLAKSVVVL